MGAWAFFFFAFVYYNILVLTEMSTTKVKAYGHEREEGRSYREFLCGVQEMVTNVGGI